MKVLAIIALLATAAYASAEFRPEVSAAFLAQGNEFVGELQEIEDGPIVHIGSPAPELNTELNTGLNTELSAGILAAGGIFGIPSCKLGLKIGMPICIAKCISRGHIAGYCKGNTCVCVG